MLVVVFTVQDEEAFLTVTDQDGKVRQNVPSTQYTNRKIFVNCCLWEGALYSIVMILKAMGKYDDCIDSDGDLDVPTAEEFYLGTKMWVRQAINRKSQKDNPDNPDYWVQAMGFAPYATSDASSSASSSGEGSLLP
jgi:hypothetical protein